MDKATEDFLNSQTRTKTYMCYITHMKHYLNFTQKTGDQLVDEKKADKDFQVENNVIQFRKWLIDQGKSENCAASCVGAIRGFYVYHRIPLVFRRQEAKKLSEKTRVTQDYLFDKEDMAKMAFAGNLKERYVLLVGKSIGLRGGDFLNLTFGHFRALKLDSEPPMALGEIMTSKEKVPAYPFLDSDSVPVIQALLDSHKYAKDSEPVIDDTEGNLSIVLHNLCIKAGLEINAGTIHGKRVRFHFLRKFLIDRLSAYASESQWKQIVGKAIGEGAYVSQEQLRGIYSRAMKDIVINGNSAKNTKLVELEIALTD